MRHETHLALGSNVGDRRHYLQLALELLSKNGNHLVKVSSLYRTRALTLQGQTAPDFLNLVCALNTSWLPDELLRRIRIIERRLGRLRHFHWQERTIDIDIISYDGRVIDHRGLQVPHPTMREREFVLRPLAEIAPHWRHPATGEFVLDLLAKRNVSSEGGQVIACCGSLSLSY